MTTAYSDPTSVNGASWDKNAASYIDDAVRSPDAATSGASEEVYEVDKAILPSESWFGNDIAAATDHTVDSWKVYFYKLSNEDGPPTTTFLIIDGVTKVASGSITSLGSSWYSQEFPGGDSLDSNVTVEMGIICETIVNGEESAHFSAVYVECIHTEKECEILRPTGNDNTLWADNSYLDIDDAVLTGSSAGDGTYVYADDGDKSEVQSWTTPSLSSITDPTQVTVYVRHKDAGISGDPDSSVNIYVGGAWQTAVPISYGSSFTWVSVQFTGTWTTANFDDFRIGITAPNSIGHGKEYHVAVVYAEVCAPVAAGGGDSQKMGKFMLFLDT
jgi:hypothetical protein